MYSWVGERIDDVLNTYLSSVLQLVMNWASVIAAGMLTLYVLLFGIAVVRGEIAEPVNTFVWKTLKLGLILAIATTANAYQSYVLDIVSGLTTSMTVAFIPTGTTAPNPTSIWTVLDDFNFRAGELVLKSLLTDTNKYIPNLMAYFLGGVFLFANAVMMLVAFAVTLFTRTLQTFVLAIGPLFILTLMWKPTAKFFDAWLGMLLSTAVLTWIAYFILGFSIGVGLEEIERIRTNFSTLNIAAEAGAYIVLMLTFALVLYQAPALASSLTGGGPSQYGAGVIKEAIRVLSRDRRPEPPQQASGGTAIRGTGLPYAAGHAAGSATRHVAAGARSVAQGTGSAGKYAYQRAAAMGRRILNK